MSDTKLTFAQKQLIVFKLLTGHTQQSIADEFNRTVDEINSISKSHWSIVEVAHFFNYMQHEPVKGGLYPLMENVLFGWYVDQQSKQQTVTNQQLTEKAKMILNVLNEPPRYGSHKAPEFIASKKWIQRFKARFKIEAPKPKTTVTNTDTQNNVLPVRSDGEESIDSNSENVLPEEWENFSLVVQSSDDEDMENALAAEAVQSQPVLTAANGVFKAHPQQSGSAYENVKIKSVVSLPQEGDCVPIADISVNVARVHEGSPDFRGYAKDSHALVDSSYGNVKIKSVVSLAQEGSRVGNVDNNDESVLVYQNSASSLVRVPDDTHDTSNLTHRNHKSVGSLPQNVNRTQNADVDDVSITSEVVQDSTGRTSDCITDDTDALIEIIDLTEIDDDIVRDETPKSDECAEASRSKKFKRSIDFTNSNSFSEESERRQKLLRRL